MTRLMYDAINPYAIPTTAGMVAGYVDGRWAWSPAGWARFATAVKVRIAVFETTNDGHVGDSEPGNMTPAGLVRWVARRRAAGADPTGYCSEGSFTVGGIEYGWAACRAAFAAAREPQPHWWVAAYPGAGATVPAGAVAHQYADLTTSGGNYDLNATVDYWPGVDGDTMDWSDKTTIATGDSVTYGEIITELAGLLPGKTGVHQDGALWNVLGGSGPGMNSIFNNVKAIGAQVAALATQLGAVDADVKAINKLDPATLEAPLQAALTAAGWTPPPAAADVATAVLATIKAQFAK